MYCGYLFVKELVIFLNPCQTAV